jgi:sodium-dependent dicarboxylate transporter 2/3/5
MRKRIISLFISLFVFILILLSPIKTPVKYGLAILILCIILWATEAIPRGITGLLPAILVPLFGIMGFEEIIVNYMSRVVLLLLSGFIIASAISKWKLDKKMVYSMLKLSTDSRIALLAIILSTGLISTIIANTTATALMLPTGLSMISACPKKLKKRFATAVLLAVAFSATIGGSATLIGTPPNLIIAQYLSKEGINITFWDWLKIMSPFSFIFLMVLWGVLIIRFNLLKREEIKVKIEKIPLEIGAKITIIIIISAIIVWSVKSFIPAIRSIDDVVVGLTAAILLIAIPIPGRKVLLGWKDLKIPWSILLMFGGGLALGNVLFVSGAAQYMVDLLPQFPNNFMLVILIISVISNYVTEILPNTAFASTFVPIFVVLARSMGINPLFVILSAGICGSMAFLLPTGTPPNAIVYKTKYFRVSEMIKTGFLLKIILLILWVLYVFLLKGFYS